MGIDFSELTVYNFAEVIQVDIEKTGRFIAELRRERGIDTVIMTEIVIQSLVTFIRDFQMNFSILPASFSFSAVLWLSFSDAHL